MGKKSPRKKRFPSLLRAFLPAFLAVFFAFTPFIVQTMISVGEYSDLPTVSRAEMSLADKEGFNHQNRFLRGDVEFFYNQWIVSEPTQDPLSVYYQTPGYWSGRNYEEFGPLTSSGYASYRYTITGLKPGTSIYAFHNTEVANRIYLNGTLCSSMGQPTKDPQLSFLDLSDEYIGHIVVPEDGIVVYVMEVGNAGDGGAAHIGSVYVEGHTILDFSNRVIAPISLGFIFASSITLALFIALSQNRWRALVLVGMTTMVGLMYVFSRDSILIGLSLTISAPLFSSLSISMFAGLIIFLMLYGLFRKPSTVNVNEALGLSIGVGTAALLYAFLHGTTYNWIPLALLMTFPLYFFVRNFIEVSKGRRDPQFMVLNSIVLGHAFLLPLFEANVFPMPFVYHPTIFAIAITVALFASGFRDIYMAAVNKRDFAMLERRYRNISNRALARLAGESETIATLSMIGESYEKSVKAGDRKLLGFSTLMRRRLLALREDKIPFGEECELESQLNDLHNSINHSEVTLLLDIEEGAMNVPPLLFETAIDEVRAQLYEGELFTLWEGKRSIGFSYPPHCFLSEENKKSIAERCSLLGLGVRFRKNGITLFEERQR